jgi:hypothetical protein
MKKANGFISKNDFYIAGLIALLSLLSFLPVLANGGEPGARAVIASQGAELFSLDLSQFRRQGSFTKSFYGAAGPMTFEFAPEKGIRVAAASCPDKICMHMSYINKPRQIIVCLPGKIYATIEPSGAAGELDAILR